MAHVLTKDAHTVVFMVEYLNWTETIRVYTWQEYFSLLALLNNLVFALCAFFSLKRQNCKITNHSTWKIKKLITLHQIHCFDMCSRISYFVIRSMTYYCLFIHWPWESWCIIRTHYQHTPHGARVFGDVIVTPLLSVNTVSKSECFHNHELRGVSYVGKTT